MSDATRPNRRRRITGALSALLIGALVTVAGLPNAAHADPSATDWYRLRMCESSNNYRINTGNGYYGAYQFDLSTWRSVGGTGYPNQASVAEQDYRALYLYRMRGWQPWTCARILGLQPDKDAGSGVIPPRGGGGGGGGGGNPQWPGVTYAQGQTDHNIAVWQTQMRARGATELPTNGYFDAVTASVVHMVQVQNAIPQGGHIGPLTWAAAWTGKFTDTGGSTAPPWPGVTYAYGMSNSDIARWQQQMIKRGATELTGTGLFGPLTQNVVNRIQLQNGIPNGGHIGPLTWAAAWTGKYTP